MGSNQSQGAGVVGDEERRNELFDALSHPHRRFTLEYLQTASTPLAVETLAAELEAWDERQLPVEPPLAVSAIETALVHNHLPRLADAGLIGYEHSQLTVTLTDRTEEVQSLL